MFSGKNSEHALLADRDDTESLGMCLVDILKNKTLAKKLSDNQQKLSSSFWTWEQRMCVETDTLEQLVNLHRE